MKNNGVSKKPLKKDESLRKRVEEDLINIQFNRPLARLSQLEAIFNYF
jgi:hypothetical protein